MVLSLTCGGRSESDYISYYNSTDARHYIPLRVSIQYHELEVNLPEKSQRDAYKAILESARDYVESLLSVFPVSGNLVLPRKLDNYCHSTLSPSDTRCKKLWPAERYEDCGVAGFVVSPTSQ